MTQFRIIPLSKHYAAQLREKGTDDFGNTIIEEVATGFGPCRISLQPFKPGHDKRLVLSHSPFDQKNAYNQPGPIFMFSGEVEEYADVHRFPVAIRELKEHFVFTLIGYSKAQWMVYTKLVKDNDTIDELISNIFDQHSEIDYLHVRSAIAGCFICKIIREFIP